MKQDASTSGRLSAPIFPKYYFNRKFKLFFLTTFFSILIFVIWLAFPQPNYKIWPPQEKDEKYLIHLTVGDFHTCLNFPDYELGVYQEWHMGAKEWYLSDNSNIYEVAKKAVADKVPGVIRFGVFSRPFWERENMPKEDVFTFWLSKEGFDRLKSALHKNRGKKISKDDSFWFFEHKKGYHLIDNCNGFIAEAVNAAGLPVRKILSQERYSMLWQLNRCRAIQNEFYTTNSTTQQKLRAF